MKSTRKFQDKLGVSATRELTDIPQRVIQKGDVSSSLMPAIASSLPDLTLGEPYIVLQKLLEDMLIGYRCIR